VQVSPSEGVANHTVPESCVGPREGDGEALTGVRIGWVLSRENNTPGTPTLCIERKATWTGASSRAPGRPGADCGRDAHYWAPPAQNRTCGIPASGSHLGCLTAKRWFGQG